MSIKWPEVRCDDAYTLVRGQDLLWFGTFVSDDEARKYFAALDDPEGLSLRVTRYGTQGSETVAAA